MVHWTRPHLHAYSRRGFLGGLLWLLFVVLTACAAGASSIPAVPTSPTVQAAATAIGTVVHSVIGTVAAAQTATAAARGTPLPTVSVRPTQSAQHDLGPAVDATRDTTVTIVIGKPTTNPSCDQGCVAPLNLKVRVGTKITWINQSAFPRTITAVQGDTPEAARKVTPATHIFDSGIDQLIYPGQSFSYTVTQAAYTFHANHKVFYLDMIHPSTLGELIIVP